MNSVYSPDDCSPCAPVNNFGYFDWVCEIKHCSNFANAHQMTPFKAINPLVMTRELFA
ncbi:hypothetical protein [Moraxella bovoculi]|uniref:hypothetical protein n=1 Tax=Moraxella bovoculi TaxID=386891 RepID=UPI0012D4596F|nr:hypothetical protein [Moraxella bovoculi]